MDEVFTGYATPTPIPTATMTPLPTMTSTGTAPSTFTQHDSPACQTCILKGTAIIVTMLPVEVALGVGFVLALEPPLLPLEILIVPLEAAALNITLVGIEYIAQGQQNTVEEIDIDPLPLLNPFNPGLWK